MKVKKSLFPVHLAQPGRTGYFYGMKQNGKPSELMGILDYILNRCTLREIDAIESAVQRRRKDLEASTGIISLNPERAAKQMSASVQTSINSSMDSIRNTFREFAANMIRKEAPELSEDQMEELINAWIPEFMSVNANGTVSSSSHQERDELPSEYSSLAKDGLVNGIPSDAMYEMICQFVTYSSGKMSMRDEAGLRDALGDWSAMFWRKFPREVQGLIKLFLAGSLTGAEFDAQLSVLLK